MRPASFNGAWGLKPTQGAINRGERQTASMTSHGVLAACPEDMWLIAIAIASRAGGDPGRPALYGPATPPPARRPGTVAVLETEAWERLDAVSRGAFEVVLRRTDDAVVERFEQSLVGVTDLGSEILAWEHYWAFRDIVANNPDGVSARGKRFFIEAAERLGAAGYEEALRTRAAVQATYALLGPRVDAVIAPTSSGPAPEWLGDAPGQEPVRWPTGDPGFNFPSSLLGAPAVNVPLMGVGGLPFGLQVMGQPGTDAKVTAIARWMGEALTPVSV
jgi:Asp-tRNA(Asn)/Glu-tRNA(Gln) amidotransferase A subunit family amidase